MDEKNKETQRIPTQTAHLPKQPGELVFFKSVCDLIQQARRNMEKSINVAMVVTYYEIGRRIIEQEQHGENRAQYGKRIIEGLSDYLTENIGKGYSSENLKLMRRFYTVYSKNAAISQNAKYTDLIRIGQSPITQFNPNISWTHYIQLMCIANEDERLLYEHEIVERYRV